MEQDWGWAISSESRVLRESCILAGLSCPKPDEVPADTVWGPWDGVSEPAPAKAYVAPKYQSTYRGGSWVDSEWNYDGYVYGGGNKIQGKSPEPIPLISDAVAKAKFLAPKSEEQFAINSKDTVERATKTLVEMKGMNNRGPIKLGKTSAVRDMVITWAIECRKFESNYDFKIDADTKVMTRYITFLGVPADWYNALTEEKKTSLWITHYAKTLENIGVTPTEYMDAVNDSHSLDITDPRWRKCDWCGMQRDGRTLKSKNFGCDSVVVCPYCISDFNSHRRELDYRDQPGAKVKSGRKGRIG